MARPYWTFLLTLALAVGYAAANNAFYAYRVAHQDEHLDPATHTWRAGYDWEAENRLTARLFAVSRALLVLLIGHALFNVGYALWRAGQDWRHLLAAALFAGVALLLLLVWAAGQVGGGMIG